jgi:hypothetical protein
MENCDTEKQEEARKTFSRVFLLNELFVCLIRNANSKIFPSFKKLARSMKI